MNKSSKSGLFLIEMIIAIAFFAIAAAVCTNLFVRSYLISEDTRRCNMAVLTAQSVVESFKASDGTRAGTSEALASSVDFNMNPGEPSGGFSLCYNKDWQPTSEQDYNFRAEVIIDEEASPRSIAVNVITRHADGSESLLYTLEACKYIP